MLSRVLSPNRVFKARSVANQCIRRGIYPVAKNVARTMTSLQNANVYRVQLSQSTESVRYFSHIPEENQLSFRELVDSLTSFENAVNLISVELISLFLL